MCHRVARAANEPLNSGCTHKNESKPPPVFFRPPASPRMIAEEPVHRHGEREPEVHGVLQAAGGREGGARTRESNEPPKFWTDLVVICIAILSSWRSFISCRCTGGGRRRQFVGRGMGCFDETCIDCDHRRDNKVRHGVRPSVARDTPRSESHKATFFRVIVPSPFVARCCCGHGLQRMAERKDRKRGASSVQLAEVNVSAEKRQARYNNRSHVRVFVSWCPRPRVPDFVSVGSCVISSSVWRGKLFVVAAAGRSSPASFGIYSYAETKTWKQDDFDLLEPPQSCFEPSNVFSRSAPSAVETRFCSDMCIRRY